LHFLSPVQFGKGVAKCLFLSSTYDQTSDMLWPVAAERTGQDFSNTMLLYGFEACHLLKSDKLSLDFTMDQFS